LPSIFCDEVGGPAHPHGCPVRFCWTRCMAWILLRFERLAAFETRKGDHAMLHQNIVFHSLLKHVPWNKFEQITEKHGADELARKLKTKRHLIALVYAQFSGATSLREIVTAMESHETRLYHVGAAPVKRSTLSDANTERPWQVFGELFTECCGKPTAACGGRLEKRSGSLIPQVYGSPA